MSHPLYELFQTVTDEKSFNRFLVALRKDCEEHERDGRRHSDIECAEGQHFQTHSTRDFLRSMEDWATNGDFANGDHGGAPILQRIAAMMFVGRFRVREHEREDDE